MTGTLDWLVVDHGRSLSLHASRLVWIVAASAVGGAAAYLVVGGLWYVVVAASLAVPALVLLHRHPMAGLLLWMATTPLVVRTVGQSARYIFWLAHRALPVVILVIVVVSTALGVRRHRLGRLGWPEVAMVGYLVASFLSIAYQSPEPTAAAILLYDRVLIPMILYTLVRLLEPDVGDLWRLAVVAIFVLTTQSLVGASAWVAPETLPPPWLGRAGERTTGSLGNPNAFGTTVLFAGMLALHAAVSLHQRRPIGRLGLTLAFLLAMTMAFLSLNRATWLAALLVVSGLLALYPRVIARISLLVAPLVVAALAGGLLTGTADLASNRVLSEQSKGTALSRLPVVMASFRMFEERPLTGWGYENFSLYKRHFETRVADLVNPEKDHSSHNLYLTILAEQGLIGLTLFLFPVLWWLVRSRGAMRKLHREGFWSQRLLVILWLVIAAHVVANNFTSVQVPFSTGMWWVTLGLIGSIVDRDQSDDLADEQRQTVRRTTFVPNGGRV